MLIARRENAMRGRLYDKLAAFQRLSGTYRRRAVEIVKPTMV